MGCQPTQLFPGWVWGGGFQAIQTVVCNSNAVRVCVCARHCAAAGSEEEAFCELERRAERCEVGANATHGLLWFIDTVYVHGRAACGGYTGRTYIYTFFFFFDLDVLIPLNASLARSSYITLGQNLVPFRASLSSRQAGGLSRGQHRQWLDSMKDGIPEDHACERAALPLGARGSPLGARKKEKISALVRHGERRGSSSSSSSISSSCSSRSNRTPFPSETATTTLHTRAPRTRPGRKREKENGKKKQRKVGVGVGARGEHFCKPKTMIW